MAKRFTDTNKYKKPFIRGLQGAYKVLWDYLYHDCDHAGIWIVDFEIAQIYVGSDLPINKADALKFFNESEKRIVEIDHGTKWFIPSFISFQYGELKESNRAHNSVINILKNKGLISSLQGAKDMDKVKDKDKELDKDKEQGKDKDKKEIKIESVIFPFNTDEFKKQWEYWKNYKSKEFKFKYKSTQSEQAALKKLARLANNNESTAIEIIHESFANSWKGFFAIKNNLPKQENHKEAHDQYTRIMQDIRS